MAFSEFDQALAEVKGSEFVEQRLPPEHLRDQVDLGYLLTPAPAATG